ncbi:hypothetical protein [Paenibacillus sp. J22TS3]|uniref:hypothetical protein n=1 Tax=Paenibacillus sp. J22TS3 TaxID=2807192 RepID=UPI001B18F145|nr:hypothetical protein [Paenibacillus sp. J22TS3]GIP24680.1 hypothetical protein J22TS3_49550 [Paenibacillus sp. J22TS3]
MKRMPEYAQIIIVGVTFRGTWSWYVSEREYWFLNVEMEDRFGIEVLDETTAEQFLNRIDDCRVTSLELSQTLEALREAFASFDEVLEFIPAIYVNFDEKLLCSQFPEPMSFEHYVPEGWTGLYQDFMERVPKAQRYWLLGGADFFNEMWNKLKDARP